MTDTRVDLSHVLHPRTGQPIEPLGYRADGRAIWPIMGGSGEDDPEGDDEEDDDSEDEEDDDSENEEDDPFEGMDKAARQKVMKAFTKAKGDAKAWREYAQGKSDTAPDGSKRKAPREDPEDDGKGKTFTRRDLDETREEAKAAGRDELMPVLIETAAVHALTEAGFTLPKDADAREGKLARAMKLMDAEDVRVENGKLVGLDDAVDGLKRDFPELFGKASGRTPPKPGNTGGGRGKSDKPKSATAQQAAALFGD